MDIIDQFPLEFNDILISNNKTFKKVLVTGGLGFIGSHTCYELLKNGYKIVILDNLSNSDINVYNNLKKLFNENVKFYEGNILDKDEILHKIFQQNEIDAVIHFAAKKAVAESIRDPLWYYENNIIGTINLLNVMKKYNVYKFIFSSSATVYGNSSSPLFETSKIGDGITNPYGRTKYMVEEILRDLYLSDNKWKIVILRYFNPIGAIDIQELRGIFGENPKDIPNNLMPIIIRVCMRKYLGCDFSNEKITIFGDDYDTKDGTCYRDYIHVVDLSRGHLLALKNMNKFKKIEEINLGTGKSTSVLELIETFEKVNNIEIPKMIGERRPGDLSIVFCNADKAKELLGWTAEKTIEDACRDSWIFAKENLNLNKTKNRNLMEKLVYFLDIRNLIHPVE
jgi:UDP-glucose 4-epimerase